MSMEANSAILMIFLTLFVIVVLNMGFRFIKGALRLLFSPGGLIVIGLGIFLSIFSAH